MNVGQSHSVNCSDFARGVWVLMVFCCLVTPAGCQKRQNDQQESKAGQRHDKGGSDSMATMNHAGHESMDGMKKQTPSELNWNSLATNQTVIARQKLATAVFETSNIAFSGNGYVTFDVRRTHKIAVRTGGRIERLFVKYNNQYVRKGEKILELYSPELNTYIEEYHYIKKQTTDSVLQARARQKLLLLGISPAQLKQIDQTGQVSMKIPLYSPLEGYVLFDPSSSGPGTTMNTGSAGMSGSMNAAGTQESTLMGTVLEDNSIREGMYVSKDQTLFWINDLKVVWGLIAVGKEYERYLRNGQRVTVFSELLPGKLIESSIQLVEQVYQGNQKFRQARVYLSNGSGRLKLNSLITASFSVPVRSLRIPASSVYDLGRVTIVWLQVGRSKAGSSIFQSRVIRTGNRSKDQVEVVSGLKAGDEIALDAGYLADSESLIQMNTNSNGN